MKPNSIYIKVKKNVVSQKHFNQERNQIYISASIYTMFL